MRTGSIGAADFHRPLFVLLSIKHEYLKILQCILAVLGLQTSIVASTSSSS